MTNPSTGAEHCTVCGIEIPADEVTWVLTNGWASDTFGEPYCPEHVPFPEPMRIELLGEFVRETRERKNVSLHAFAGMAGISDPIIKKFEEGSLGVRYSTVTKILRDGLGVEVNVVLEPSI